jgi:hypothetical protein
MKLTFFNEKTVDVLIAMLRECPTYVSRLERKADVGLCFLFRKKLKLFEYLGLCISEKVGRSRIVHLTEEGESIAYSFVLLRSKLRKLGYYSTENNTS